MSPTNSNGKICYVELPAQDVAASARFYNAVFGWETRTRGDGSTAFDDATGQVSGAFRADRRPYDGGPGALVYVMCDDVEKTLQLVTQNGGEIVQPIGGDAPEITAYVRDPGGNLIGLYQERA